MEIISMQKTERKKPISSKINKKIFDGIVNSNFSNLIKTHDMRFNNEKFQKIRKNKKIMDKRKELVSAPFIKRYSFEKLPKDYNNNSDKKTQNNSNKKNLLFKSILHLSSPYNKENPLYKNLKSEVYQKNFGKTVKNVNLNLYRNITTNYLNQKESDKIPILYPFFATFDFKYNSKSQRERYIKNLNKLIQVRTHLTSNKTDHFKIISEFMIKNGINEKRFINSDNMLKIENFLKRPLNEIPNFTMKQILRNIINTKTNKSTKNPENKKIILNNEDNIEPRKSRNQLFRRKKIDINNFTKSNSTMIFRKGLYLDDSRIVKLGIQYSYLFDKNHPNHLIDSIENELKTLKLGKINKFEKNNRYNGNEINLMKSFEDKNKLVPNLCLSSYGFSERYRNKILRYNKKLKNIISKNEKIRDINKRMYYDSKKNKNLKEFDLTDVRKYHKITELVVLNHKKKELLNKQVGEMNYGKDLKDLILTQKNN